MYVALARLLIAFLAVALASSLTAPITRGQSDTIKIVSSFPKTGETLGESQSMVNAIKMAMEEASYSAGGFKIVHVDLDDGSVDRDGYDSRMEADNATGAASDPDVMAYITGSGHTSIPILSRANVVTISPTNSDPALTKPGLGAPNEPDVYYPTDIRSFVRVSATDDREGSAGVKWASQLGLKRAYVLDDRSAYGHVVAAEFVSTAKKADLQIVGGQKGIDPRAADYRGLATKISDAGPDLVYFAGEAAPEAIKVFKDLRATLDPSVSLMVPGGTYDSEFLDSLNGAGDGIYVTSTYVPPAKLTGKGADWFAEYKAKYTAEPEVGAANAYEAAGVILDAIKKAAAKDRDAIRTAVFATKGRDGLFGKWSFDQNGDSTPSTLSGRQIKNGQFDEANAILLTVE